MKRVLLTGGTGFIGANLARRLLVEGHELHLTIRPDHDDWRISEINPHIEPHRIDLLDRDGLRETVERIRPDWIFHLAVYGAYSWQQDFGTMQRTNVSGTQNLVDACAKVGFEAFVNTGSSSEYGFVDRPTSEDDPPDPNSAYAFTKAAATLFCRYAARLNDLPMITLRIYSAYGPFEDPLRLIPTVIVNGLKGRLPPLVGRDVARDFVYIDDVVEAFLLAAHGPISDPGAIYNVASGRQSSIGDVVALARAEFRIAEQPRWGSMEPRSWDTSTWAGRPDKIRRDLGWSASVQLEHGFKTFVRWFEDSPKYESLYRAALDKRSAP